MLTLVKSWVGGDLAKPTEHETVDFPRLQGLQAGSAIVFGDAAPEHLAQKKARIVDTRTYVFEDDVFLSYTLKTDTLENIHVIIAQSAGEEYLALSRRITAQEQDQLFGLQSLKDLLDKPASQQLRCKENVQGFASWVGPSYRKQMMNIRGVSVAGDCRGEVLNPRQMLQSETAFTYALLANPTNEYAIEIEEFADGRMDVYTTCYRPLNDIIRIIQPDPSVKNKKSVVRPRPWTADSNMDTVIEALRNKRAGAEIIPHPAVREKSEMLECDVRIAVRVIEEAVLNHMPVADVVRRVVDLPVNFQEKVYFSLPLSTADYEILSKRYGILASDHQAIRARIVEELAAFTG